MAFNSFQRRTSINNSLQRARYNLALEELAVNRTLINPAQNIPCRENPVCLNSPNPYSIVGTCKTVYLGTNCPFEVDCPPREPKVFYNGNTGVIVEPPVEDIDDINPFTGVRVNPNLF